MVIDCNEDALGQPWPDDSLNGEKGEGTSARLQQRKEFFHFKQFTVRHRDSAMKVGFDSVLLGGWTQLKGEGHALDIGCGCGVLALMLAQRFPAWKFTGVELDEGAAREAEFNVNESPWSDRITIVLDSVISWAARQHQRYEAIVCNPPYFQQGVLPTHPSRQQARHHTDLTLEVLLQLSRNLLLPGGSLHMILPVWELERIKAWTEHYGLGIQKRTIVFPAPGKKAKRMLLEVSAGEVQTIEDELLIESAGHWTTAYRQLVETYYLHEK